MDIRPTVVEILKRRRVVSENSFMRLPGHRRGLPAGEQGFGLIEVMVTCLVLTFIAAATVTSIATSQRQSGRTLARNVTANLAEKDQERMRAMRASDLTGYSATSTVSQENINYTVDSKAQFVQDAGSNEVSCTTTGEQAKYLRLTSTVTPPRGTKGTPLTVNSLYALPIAEYSATSGTLVVKVIKSDAAATPQPDVPVSISLNGSTKTGTTNAAGCAIFQFVTPGTWSISLNKSGYTDQYLAQPSTGSGVVSPGNISSTTMIYEQAGTINATIDTDGVTQAFDAPGITIFNSQILSTSKTRTFSSASATGLFPFTGAYAVYSGTCAANDPTTYETAYYTNHPGFGQATVTSGGTSVVKLREPAINATVNVKYYTGSGNSTTTTTAAGVNVTFTAANSGCNSAKYTTTTKANGTLNAPGAPFGDYNLCASATGTVPKPNNGGTTTGTWRVTKSSQQNRAFAGTAPFTMTIDTTGSTGAAC